MVSFKSLVEMLKSVAKLGLVGYVAYRIVMNEKGGLALLADMDVTAILAYIMKVNLKIFFWCTVLILVLAIIDFVYQRWQHEKNLKMSKQEVKDEFKQREGDPMVKSRIRNIQRKMAHQRMMTAVPTADAIITNPTHLAVAIKYDAVKMDAPRVVAKGAGFVAERIKKMAQAYGVPIIENKPLARALFKLEIGQLIPADLYKAVAEVLAYVYKLKRGRRRAAG